MENRRPVDKGMLVGAVLIGIGALFLLQTLGVIGFMWRTTVAVAFLGGAAAFLSVFVGDNRQWWATFPAAGLGFIGLSMLFPHGSLPGVILFACVGAAFFTVWSVRRDWIWPIIPGGACWTLALVTLFDSMHRYIPFFNGGGIFFFGLAVTFAAVWFLARDRHAHNWALIVAAILGGIGTLVVIGSMMKYVVPIGLILLGVYALTNYNRNGNHTP